MRVDISIPARNEESIIADSVRAVRAVLATRYADARVIVADNGTDDTATRAREVGAEVMTVTSVGKGAAVVAAARSSNAEAFGFIDADLSADPKDITLLLEDIETDAYDIAIGSRLIDTKIVHRSALRTFSSKVFNILRQIILGISAHDTQCGLKVMNAKGKDILMQCTEKGWFFDMEFLARAERAGLRIHEVSVHWDEHRFPDRKSKLRLIRDGVGAVLAMIRIRWNLMAQ